MTDPISSAHTIPPGTEPDGELDLLHDRMESHEQQLREVRGALRALRVEQLEQREMLEELLRRLPPGGT